MRKKCFMLVLLLLLLPLPAVGEEMQAELGRVIESLDLQPLISAAADSPLASMDVQETLTALSKGQAVLNAEQTLSWILRKASGIFHKSLWRMTRLFVPVLLVSLADLLTGAKQSSAKAARYAGVLLSMVFLVADLQEHTALTRETISKMADLMQSIFPIMMTLLAAVGGRTSSAFYQPTVLAAAGTMTTLVEQVTMPFAVSMAVLTMVSGLSSHARLSGLCRFFRQAANWTLGFGFTVFIGVMSVQGLGAAAVDGVSIRTAKYAIDNFVPIVGGMFADTVDTLVGCSVVIQNAVGALGLILLLGVLVLPLLRIVMTLFLYRGVSALLQPVSDNPLCKAVGEYGDVFSLLFIIELSVGAMFLLLAAQLITATNVTVMLR